MQTLALALCALVAVEHFYFLVLESFLWTHPRGLKTFGQTLEQARATASLAANQGLYNGFLGAGLLWGIWQQLQHGSGFPLFVFFLSCVLVAAVVGGLTAKRSILVVQGVPAALAFLAVVLGLRG